MCVLSSEKQAPQRSNYPGVNCELGGGPSCSAHYVMVSEDDYLDNSITAKQVDNYNGNGESGLSIAPTDEDLFREERRKQERKILVVVRNGDDYDEKDAETGETLFTYHSKFK